MSSLSEKLSADALMALKPCNAYTRSKVEELVKDPGFLLTIPFYDAYWALARLLSSHNRAIWVQACVRRATGYAAAAATRAANSATNAAATRAATYANAAATYATYAANAASLAASYANANANTANTAANAEETANQAVNAAYYAAAHYSKAESLEAICHAVSLIECQGMFYD